MWPARLRSCENHDTVRILMIAPEPFFEPRGTPFSEFHRIRALTELGHQVDLVTYPFGRDVTMPGLRVFRSAAAAVRALASISDPRSRRSRSTCCSRSRRSAALWRQRYDAIHSHEEGGLIGVVLAAALACSASVRHALELAAAVDELRVQPLATACAGCFWRSSA